MGGGGGGGGLVGVRGIFQLNRNVILIFTNVACTVYLSDIACLSGNIHTQCYICNFIKLYNIHNILLIFNCQLQDQRSTHPWSDDTVQLSGRLIILYFLCTLVCHVAPLFLPYATPDQCLTDYLPTLSQPQTRRAASI